MPARARVRCVQTGDRDVHAWVAGEIADGPYPEDLVRIGYRPSAPGFRRRDTDQIITRAELVRFAPDGSAWALNPREEPLECAP